MGRAAQARGHELTVVAPGASDGATEHGGMKLVRYRAPAMPYDPTYRAAYRLDEMRRLVAREQPHVLQISSPFAPALAARSIRDVPVRVYVHHSDPIGCYVRPLLQALPSPVGDCIERAAWSWHRRISRFCDATVVAGSWLETELSSWGCQGVTSVAFGVDRSELGPERRDLDLRARLMGPLASDPDAVLVLIAGRLAMDKRQALSVEALQVVQRARPVALVVLGDGPERARLQEKTRGLGHVTFLPFTRDRREFGGILASVDLLLHAARCETFGFVLAEALSSGTPIVVPRAGGAAALAHPDYAETYAADADAETVARAVHALALRPREAMARAAVRASATLPSLEQHFDDLFAFYARLLAMRSAQSVVSRQQ